MTPPSHHDTPFAQSASLHSTVHTSAFASARRVGALLSCPRTCAQPPNHTITQTRRSSLHPCTFAQPGTHTFTRACFAQPSTHTLLVHAFSLTSGCSSPNAFHLIPLCDHRATSPQLGCIELYPQLALCISCDYTLLLIRMSKK